MKRISKTMRSVAYMLCAILVVQLFATMGSNGNMEAMASDVTEQVIEQINIPDNQQAIYECKVVYVEGSETGIEVVGNAGSGNLFKINGYGLYIGGVLCKCPYVSGVYQVKIYLNPIQYSARVEVTLPDGQVIRRGSVAFLYGSTNITQVNAYSTNVSEYLTDVKVSYHDINQNDYVIETTEPVYEGFEANVHNLVTSFDVDGKTTRTFAWTALESYIDSDTETMSLKYREKGAEEWNTVAAVKETEKTEEETEDYFKADLTGLTAGTTYEYKIGKTNSSDENNDWSKVYSFKTEEENVNEFSFVAIGDTQGMNWNGTGGSDGKGYMYTQAALEEAIKDTEDPAFMLHTGDVVEYASDLRYWNSYFKALGDYGKTLPAFTAVGNHDVAESTENFDLHYNHPNNGGSKALADGTVEAVEAFQSVRATSLINNIDETIYSFDYGNAHFVVLNSGIYATQNTTNNDSVEIDKVILEGQRAWLENDLKENADAKWTIVVVHQGTYCIDEVQSRPWLHDIIEEYGVDLVIQGHEHLVTRTYPMKGGEIVSNPNTDVIEEGIGTVYTMIGATTTNHNQITSIIDDKFLVAFTPDTHQPTYTTVAVNDKAIKVTTKQVDGLVVDEFTIADFEEKQVKFEYFSDISPYRGEIKTHPEKEGYVFAGWWQGEASDVISDDMGLLPVEENAVTGGAWAKFVPEEVLSVKAQTTDLLVDNPESTKMRLVSTVDSLRYREVGFKIKYNQGDKEYTHATNTVYEKILAIDANDIPFQYTPAEFAAASEYFVAYTVTDINEILFNNYEFKVTPYWITLDGTVVAGSARERLLVTDQRAGYADGCDFTVQDKTYTYMTEKSDGSSVSYQYFMGAASAVYVKGTYKKADENNQFGISVRSGGVERQIFFAKDGVDVVNKDMDVPGLLEGKTVTILASAKINDMLSADVGTEVAVVWQIIGNVLSCSLDGVMVYEIQMTDLCTDWKEGRYYQLGLAGYNKAATSEVTFELEEYDYERFGATYTVSGVVSTPISSIDASEVQLTLVDKENSANVYQVTPDESGRYAVKVPNGVYTLTAVHDAFLANTYDVTVLHEETAQDITLRKNVVSGGYNIVNNQYVSAGEYHDVFSNYGYGTAWMAEIEVPSLIQGQKAGFILHKRENGNRASGAWMRIALEMGANGKLAIAQNLCLDNVGDSWQTEDITATLSETESNILQLIYQNRTMTLKLNGEILKTYDTTSVLSSNTALTIDTVLNLSGEVYCGLYTNQADVTFKDWLFTDMADVSVEHTLSGQIISPINGVNMSDVKLVLKCTTDNIVVSETTPDTEGAYSFTVPGGSYQLIATHEAFVANVYDIDVFYGDVKQDFLLRKNVVSGGYNIVNNHYVSSTAAYHGTFLHHGYGTTWLAEIEVPALTQGQTAGFVLHKSANGNRVPGAWMRIALEMGENGKLAIAQNLCLDNVGDSWQTEGITATLSEAESNILQLIYQNQTMTLKLNGEILKTYDTTSVLSSNTDLTIDTVLNLSGDIHCSLYSKTANVTFADWMFANRLNPDGVYTVTGTVDSPVGDVDLTAVNMTLVNVHNTKDTYTTTPNGDGVYAFDNVPNGNYTLKLVHSAFVTNTYTIKVLHGQVVRDITLRKNTVNGGYTIVNNQYVSTSEYHDVFSNQGYGTTWFAEIEVPKLEQGQKAGFILHKRANESRVSGAWMRIALEMGEYGRLHIAQNLCLDGTGNSWQTERIAGSLSETRSNKLQLVYQNQTLTLKLNGQVLKVYETDTVLSSNKALTVGGVLNLSGEVYCGLYSNKANITFIDWIFATKEGYIDL